MYLHSYECRGLTRIELATINRVNPNSPRGTWDASYNAPLWQT
nr:MAG TPA: hypothetical protein [Caudoviricetes sp.]